MRVLWRTAAFGVASKIRHVAVPIDIRDQMNEADQAVRVIRLLGNEGY